MAEGWAIKFRPRRLLTLLVILAQFLCSGIPVSTAVTYPFEIVSAGKAYPYVASLWYSEDGQETWKQFCSGTLIKSDLILTAAHCTRNMSGEGYDLAAQVGANYFRPNVDSPGWIPISQLWWNPRYSKEKFTNDIGLFLLDSQLGSSVAKPLSLPTSAKVAATKASTKYTILGWGIDQNGDSPSVLQGANIVDQAAAAKKIWKTNFNPTTMIAAGAYNKKEKVYSGGCNGDSGGPLITTLKNAKVLMGVTSWGSSNCDKARPTIFTRVSYYLKDIATGEKTIRDKAAEEASGDFASQKISFEPISNMVYGSDPFSPTIASDSDLEVSLDSTTPATCVVEESYVNILKVGTCSLTASQDGDEEYGPAEPVTQKFSITPANLTVMASSPSVPYWITKPTVTPIFRGFVNGDNQSSASFTAGLKTPTCSVASPLSSKNKKVKTICSGGSATNYKFIFTSGSATISTLADQVYGIQPFSLAAGSASALTVTFSTSTSAICTVNKSMVTLIKVGTCSITATQTSGSKSSETESFKVKPATLVVSASSPTVVFGDSIPTISPLYSGFVNDDDDASPSFVTGLTEPTCSTSYTILSEAGSEPSTSCVGGSAANYIFSYVDGFITIEKSPQTISFDSLPNQVYGSTSFIVAATSSAQIPVSFSSTTPAVCSVSNTAVSILKVGTCTIAAEQDGDPDYAPAEVITQSFTVTPAVLTVTASSPSVTYGSLKPAITPVYSKFLNGDTQASDSFKTGLIAPTCSTAYTPLSPVGSSPVTICSGGSAANYTFIFVNSSVKITKASQAIIFTPPSTKTYGAADSALTATSNSNLLISFSSLTPETCSIVSGKVSIVGAGMCELSASQLGNGNFNAAPAATASFSIEKAQLTVTSSSGKVNFGASSVRATPIYSGFEYDDNSETTTFMEGLVPPVCSVDLATALPVGGKYVSTCAGGESANYIFSTFINGSYDVVATAPAAPTIGVARALNSTSATITYFAPTFKGGATITKYTATSSPGGITGSALQPSSGTITVKGLTAGVSYTFTVTAQNSAGTSAPSAATNSVDTSYYLGGTGPGGGIIFYDAGSVQLWGRYLEVAPKTWYGGGSDPSFAWSRNTNAAISTGSAVGTGSSNTDAMVALDNAPGYAATAIRTYAGDGGTTLGQWFLPSTDEWNLLCSYFTGQPQDPYANYYNACSGNAITGRGGAGGFTQNYYWTSTQDSYYTARGMDLQYGSAYTFREDRVYIVRPIRAFGGLATTPAAPTIGVARALSSTSATVTFLGPSTSGGTTYIATSSPGGITGSVDRTGSGTITVKGLTAGVSYTFTVTAQNSAGTSAPSAATNSVDTSYYLGGTGPGGGIIFYDAGSVQLWGRYLEVAPKTWYGGGSDPSFAWSRNTNAAISTGSAVGTGSSNTDAMVALDNAPGYAATAIRTYAGDGGTTLGQWFLPSTDEWNLLCSYFTGQPQDPYANYYNACSGNAITGRGGAGGFTQNYYWTSTQDSYYTARGMDLQYGSAYTFREDRVYIVRPIRAFE